MHKYYIGPLSPYCISEAQGQDEFCSFRFYRISALMEMLHISLVTAPDLDLTLDHLLAFRPIANYIYYGMYMVGQWSHSEPLLCKD